MQLTTKSRYVIRAMIDLAIFSGNGPVLVKDIAQRQKMSARYLEQLLLAPKAAGMIRSMRGAHGGFTLTRAPSEITLREIVQSWRVPFPRQNALMIRESVLVQAPA